LTEIIRAIFDSVRRAQTAGAGAVFGLFLLDTFTFDTDYEWLGDIAFSRYFDPGAILIEGDASWSDLSILLIAIIVLVVASAEYFERRDLSV
jgi:ABC-2 type transport system permease protein